MPIRTYGLSGSGMDVDKLVTDMMKAQRVRYDSMAQKKTLVEWKKADLNIMYTAINAFRNSVYNYKLSTTVQPKQVISSNDSVVKASANAAAANVSHTINVEGLAEGAQKVSSASITPEKAVKDTLSNQFYDGAWGSFDAFTIKISDGAKSKDIKVDPSKSIYDLVKDINSAGTNIKANYDAALDRFFVYNNQTGFDQKIDFTGSSPDGLTFLNDKLKLDPNAVANGEDAKFYLDGLKDSERKPILFKQKTNNFTISGVTYDLKGKGTATINIMPDNDKAVEAVKSFVDDYNALLSTINGKLSEKRYKNFLPLTADQRSAMSESEIKNWEEKAKSGMLLRHPMLQNLVYSIRNDISNPVAGLTGINPVNRARYNTMASIGITTGSWNENGKLYLDEAKLKEALEYDPDIVSKMFATNGDDSSEQGIATRLYDTLQGGIEKIKTEAGITPTETKSTLAKLIKDYDDSLYNFNKKLIALEERYYQQFNAMEAALNKISQQSNWLAKQFGS